MCRKTYRNAFLMSLAAGAFMTFGAAPAQAGFTTVKAAKPSEKGIEAILENTYGGDFSLVGHDYTNGSVTAHRIDDDLDQVWTGGTFDITAKAKFSGYSQSIGFIKETLSGPATHLLDVSGFGFGATGSLSHVTIGDDFCFTRDGDSGSQMSETNENSDGRDHLVSFAIEGVSNSDTWMLFFEDMNLTPTTSLNHSYADFNDLVLQVNRSTQPIAAPLPPAVFTGAFLLAGNWIVGGLRKKRMI